LLVNHLKSKDKRPSARQGIVTMFKK